MKEVIKKGYTITVDSWENDGDNSRTKSITVETKEEAEKIFRIFTELFEQVGNSMDGEENQTLVDYVKNNPDLFPELLNEDEDRIVDYFKDIAYDLMGNSEWYDFRVCESCTVVYSDKDIYLEEVKF